MRVKQTLYLEKPAGQGVEAFDFPPLGVVLLVTLCSKLALTVKIPPP